MIIRKSCGRVCDGYDLCCFFLIRGECASGKGGFDGQGLLVVERLEWVGNFWFLVTWLSFSRFLYWGRVGEG